MENHTVYAKSADVQVTAKLTIKDFFEVMKTSEPGKWYATDTFMVGDTPMAIKVYPNGAVDKNKGNVFVFLSNQSDAALSVKCQFITDVKTSSFDIKMPANEGLGPFKFLSHVECTEAYKEKDFVVTAKVEISGKDLKIMGNQPALVPAEYCVALCKNLYEMEMDTNFTLAFQGAEVPCHKHVLAAASSVFKAMVENQHMEAIESKANIELSGEVGRAFVKFIYTGELEEDMLKEHAMAFLELGNKYDVQELKDSAEAELLMQLDKKNMVQLVSIGDLFNANKIFEAALEMTKANMTWLRNQVYNMTIVSEKCKYSST